MKQYMVYFEAFGRKLKIKVKANDPKHAEQVVKDKIGIIKVEPNYESLNDIADSMKDFIDKLSGK